MSDYSDDAQTPDDAQVWPDELLGQGEGDGRVGACDREEDVRIVDGTHHVMLAARMPVNQMQAGADAKQHHGCGGIQAASELGHAGGC